MGLFGFRSQENKITAWDVTFIQYENKVYVKSNLSLQIRFLLRLIQFHSD